MYHLKIVLLMAILLIIIIITIKELMIPKKIANK